LRTISILTSVPSGRELDVWKKAPPEHIFSVTRLRAGVVSSTSRRRVTTSILAATLSLNRSSFLRSVIAEKLPEYLSSFFIKSHVSQYLKMREDAKLACKYRRIKAIA
jgi:hypothetical protein